MIKGKWWYNVCLAAWFCLVVWCSTEPMLGFSELFQPSLSLQCRDPQCWSSNPDSVWNYLEPNNQSAGRENWNQNETAQILFILGLFLCCSPETGHRWFYSDNSKKLLFSCCWHNRKKITLTYQLDGDLKRKPKIQHHVFLLGVVRFRGHVALQLLH